MGLSGPMSWLLVATKCSDLILAHNPGNAIDTTALSSLPEIRIDPTTAIGATARLMGVADQFKQPLIVLATVRNWLMCPGVKSCPINFQCSAHGFDAKPASMFIDKCVLYSGSLAKYAAAFFVCHAPPWSVEARP